MWDERVGAEAVAAFRPPARARPQQPWDRARGIRFAADAARLAAAGSDGALRVWDVRRPDACVADWQPHEGSIWALGAEDDLSVVYTGGRDGFVRAPALAAHGNGGDRCRVSWSAVWLPACSCCSGW
jgi:WD40 repeat protein